MNLTRRDLLRLSILTGGATLINGKYAWAQLCGSDIMAGGLTEDTGCGTGGEAMPFSPLILVPFSEDLPVPSALRPGWRPSPADPGAAPWTCRVYNGRTSNAVSAPGPGVGAQDAFGDRPNGKVGIPANTVPHAGTHQLWPGQGVTAAYYNREIGASTTPIQYHIRLQVAPWRITNSAVMPIGAVKANKNKAIAIAGVPLPLGATDSGRPLEEVGGTFTVNGVPVTVPVYKLPFSAIYGFNGTFPGPLINAMYGRPVVVRFENDLDFNPSCLDRQDFGAPDWAFLTHLHNGHTAPECDGQPSHLTEHEGGYQPGEWCDNLYLMYPAGNDDREKQSFLWFHDHRMHHTGPNVYKGMVGLMPHYDPVLDNGDERTGLRLPGVKADNGDGSFDVKYDIPMALYDYCANDGVTQHRDEHTPLGPACGATHPEWWGKSFHKHYPNHGFVGDIFTVNCKAYPVLHVKPRRYRFRFLGASISRAYELSIMSGEIAAFPGQQGQYNFVTRNRKGELVRSRGTLAMNMRQIAAEGGLLPFAIDRDFIQIWPAKRREVVVDFSGRSGETMYLANTLFMPNGRKPVFGGEKGADPAYCVPLLKIVVDVPMDGEVDNSLMPAVGTAFRPAPSFAADPATLTNPTFTLARGGLSEESQWTINSLGFIPDTPLHIVKQGVPEVWTVQNGGGGWTHPMHMHMEEHQVLERVGSVNPHPEDNPNNRGKEDVIALDPSERVTLYRNFRTFKGHYVAHCHQLAHEDHNMMFGWSIT